MEGLGAFYEVSLFVGFLKFLDQLNLSFIRHLLVCNCSNLAENSRKGKINLLACKGAKFLSEKNSILLVSMQLKFVGEKRHLNVNGFG